ncbi:MAG: MCE family protein [Fulvimarina manganoxydans]|uniref:MCE family protein n=1 Tax=Fulvimarina manganoxydans TaxID=937218 RepID=UPI0023557148|nr:MCE family protein [Fulvimarina manganoxydans]MCK5934727.1 MCE family protein [Fulvimarina manganoxydans]
METKANYVRVGIFTIVALALAFGFVYWSIFSRQDQSDVTLLVRIEGSVTGLQQGSQVLFNGLPVGSVQSLRLDPNNPRVVIATTQVQPDIPIKESTQANIGFQGLTGNAFVELRGGDVEQENIIQEAQAQGAVPVITANPSDVTDILATARDISERANNILGQFESIVQAVGPSVRDSATNITEITRNVNQFTAGLAANSDDIDNFVANLSDLARSASTVAQALPGVISNVQAIVAAIDPADVGRTVENIAAASGEVRNQTENLGNILASVQTAANGVGQIGDAIERNAAGIDDFLGNLGPLSETATRVASNLDTTVTSANRILGAVDEETVTDTLNGLSATATNLSAVSETVANQREAIETAITGASNVVANVDRVTTTIANRTGQIDAMLSRLDDISASVDTLGTRLNETVAEASNVISSVDPQVVTDTIQSLSDTVSNLSGVSETLSNARQTITDLLTGASAVVDDANQVSSTIAARSESIGTALDRLDPITIAAEQTATSLRQTSDQARQVIAAVDPAQISQTVDNLSNTAANLSAVSDTVANQREAITTAITGATNAIQNINRLTTTVAGRTQEIDTALQRLDPITQSILQASNRLSTTVTKAGDFVDAIDTQQLNGAIDEVSRLATTVGSKSETIASIIDGVNTTVRTLDTALQGFSETRAQVDTLLASIDPGLVNTAVENISSATTNIASAADSVRDVGDIIGARKEDIDRILSNADVTSQRLAAASGQLDDLITSANNLLDGSDSGRPLGTDLAEALRAVRDAAASIQTQVTPISANLQRFSGEGLRDLQNLIQTSTQAVNRIERAVTDFSNDPSQIIFGGDGANVKTYDGRTRR